MKVGKYVIKEHSDLRGADLAYKNLSSANLFRASLSRADLCKANLWGANLRGAFLCRANMQYCDLRNADLSGADLSGACLVGADLTGANLNGTNLQNVDLRGSIGAKYDHNALWVKQSIFLPEGTIYGWKKCFGNVLVKLRIPETALRCHAIGGRKCRAEYAEVVEIIGKSVAVSQYDPSFMYKVGEIVRPTGPFCMDYNKECASGIHFFITREEAEAYLC